MNNKERLFGMRIVPEKDKNGLVFGGFEGIVISGTGFGLRPVEISKMINKEGGYFVDSFIQISSTDSVNHSSSAKEEVSFLYSKALDLIQANEEIAIAKNLAMHFQLRDEADKKLAKLEEERRKQ